MKVKVISLPYIFQVLYVLCFTRPRYQVSVYRTIGSLVLQMFEKDSDVKQGNITATKYGLQCTFSAKNHVQMARKFHDLNMDLGRLLVCLTIASNNFTHSYLCKKTGFLIGILQY